MGVLNYFVVRINMSVTFVHVRLYVEWSNSLRGAIRCPNIWHPSLGRQSRASTPPQRGRACLATRIYICIYIERELLGAEQMVYIWLAGENRYIFGWQEKTEDIYIYGGGFGARAWPSP